MSVETGRPKIEGLYAAHVYFGWKLLEWRDGAWWHQSKVGRWMAKDPTHFVHLPDVDTQTETKQEFDL